MKLELRRKTETAESVQGILLVDEQEECWTLEPARVRPVHEGHPCIPAGEYHVILSFSPHFKMVTPEVMGVVGRENIRIHAGNYPKDSLGCILVGDTRQPNFVGLSKAAFASLLTLLKTATDPITLLIEDPVRV